MALKMTIAHHHQTSSTPIIAPSTQQRSKTVVTKLGLTYTIVFLSGIYCGILISGSWRESVSFNNALPENFADPNRRPTFENTAPQISRERTQKRLRTEIDELSPVVDDRPPAEDEAEPAEEELQENFPPQEEGDIQQEKRHTSWVPPSSVKDMSTRLLSPPSAIKIPAILNRTVILYDNLPHSKPGGRTTVLPKIYKTTKSIAGCLFIMDDTIRLLEWLAYHYTVLPLSHLMVAIDPKSHKVDRIMEILDAWRDKIDIKAYGNDTEWLDLPWDYGYSRSIRTPSGHLMKWFKEKTSDIYIQQVHKRRQNYFCVHCMRYMKERGMDWTIITDSDEYVIFNYPHPKEENRSLYDSIRRGTTAADIDKDREHMKPYRDRLPPMNLRATIADFLHQEKLRVKCILFPGLQFTSYESRPKHVFRDVPEGVNPYHLVTLRHRKAGRREGVFSKTMVDVSQGLMDDYTMETNFNVHIPNKLLCGINSHSGSCKDYQSALFRLHHYRTGTWESFIERSADRRATMTVERFMERNIEPVLIDDDIRPWIQWFVEKVGMDEVRRLLVDPLAEAYAYYEGVPIQRRL